LTGEAQEKSASLACAHAAWGLSAQDIQPLVVYVGISHLVTAADELQ